MQYRSLSFTYLGIDSLDLRVQIGVSNDRTEVSENSIESDTPGYPAKTLSTSGTFCIIRALASASSVHLVYSFCI